MSVLAVIPARLASSRLQRKVLLNRTGKPLIQHVWESTARAAGIDRLVVATDSDEVVAACEDFGAEAVMTPPELPSGTDRVAWVARDVPDATVVVNVQGDEPEMDPGVLEQLVAAMTGLRDPLPEMGTVSVPWPEGVPLDTAGNVKVVTDAHGYALYFSRSVVPHLREGHGLTADALAGLHRRHVGLYAYRRDFLLRFAAMPPCDLERAESLEQLRALHAGARIIVVPVQYEGMEVNTPEDYEAFVARMSSRA